MGTKLSPHRPAPRQRRGLETRAAILGAAERVFAEAGLAGARTDAIASGAGVNKALLYYYFKSKDALYRAVLEDHLREFRRRALEVLSAGGSARSALLRFVTTHFDFVGARPYYPRLAQRMVMTGGRPLERLAQEHIVPVYQKLVDLIERGIRAGEFRAVDSHNTVLSIVALTVFYFSAAPMVKVVGRLDPYQETHLTRRKGEVLEFIRHALFRQPEERWS